MILFVADLCEVEMDALDIYIDSQSPVSSGSLPAEGNNFGPVTFPSDNPFSIFASPNRVQNSSTHMYEAQAYGVKLEVSEPNVKSVIVKLRNSLGGGDYENGGPQVSVFLTFCPLGNFSFFVNFF